MLNSFCRREELERRLIEKELGKQFIQEGDSNGVDEEPPPEDAIPDLPENAAAREFLKKAPTKGLHMPLGVEVKVMQCFRCKAYGHRTGDRECPLANQGNFLLDSERQAREDPMAKFVATRSKEREEKYARVEELKLIVEQIRKEEAERKKRKAERKEHKHKKSKHKSEKSHKRKKVK